jgi:endonuclease/exonuclease/phosphatase family metal-dependent hydrolase
MFLLSDGMASCNILIWNARGLNDRSRRDMVHQVVQSCRSAIVCLQETKLAHITMHNILSFLGQDFSSSFVFLPAQQTRGGILVAWRSDMFTAECHRVHRHSVSVKFRMDAEHSWWFSGIYGPHLDSDKPSFLEELREVRHLCSGPWMLAGDFNMIYSSEDKNNDNLNMAMMGRFRRFVNDLELKEIPLLGRRYTWSNERASPTLVKLDRVLCTSNWEDLYPIVCFRAMQLRCLIIVLSYLGYMMALEARGAFTLRASGRNCRGFWKLSRTLGMNLLE